MFKKVLKGFLVLAACFAVTAVSAKEVKAEKDPVKFYMYDESGDLLVPSEGIDVTNGESFHQDYFSDMVSQVRTCEFKNSTEKKPYKVTGSINGHDVPSFNVTSGFPNGAGLWDRTSGSMSIDAYKDGDNYVVSFSIQAGERYGHIQLPSGKYAKVTFLGDINNKSNYALDSEPHDLVLEPYVNSCNGKIGTLCGVCGYELDTVPATTPAAKTEAPKQEVKAEEKHEDLSAKAFGGRKAEQLSVAEQKSAVSYALESLRAGGNALPAQAVTVNVGGKAQDIAAVVAEDRNATNQQMFAQVMATRLGFKKVTALKTYDMYALSASSTVKNNAQVIKWANTGLKAGDTAFVVWYNQKLGRTELLPAVVGVDGSVAVNVPALGDVSTMTIVKADK